MSDISGEVITQDQAEFIPGGRGGSIRPIRDAVRAAELARIRWNNAGVRARAAAVKAGQRLPDINLRGPLDMLEYVAEQHWMNAADPSAPGSVQSFREVMRIAYPAPERGLVASTVPAGGAQLNLSPELARELLAELRARRGG